MTIAGGERIRIGVSSCLLGQRVRHDGGHKRNDFVVDILGPHVDFVPFCPELAIGLGVPRPPVRLVATAAGARARGVRDPGLDITAALAQCARTQHPWQARLSGYILKKGSPSCGMERVRLYRDGVPTRHGVGLYAAALMAQFPLLPVEEEGRLGDPGLRASFLERVAVLHRWQRWIDGGISAAGLTTFHSRHKLLLMSHHQSGCRALGRLLGAGAGAARPLETVALEYITGAMALLRRPATRRNHVNVLQHIQGYLKRRLDPGDKAELSAVIERFRLGQLPLVAPITLLNHHFRREPDRFIAESYYLTPAPWDLLAGDASR